VDWDPVPALDFLCGLLPLYFCACYVPLADDGVMFHAMVQSAISIVGDSIIGINSRLLAHAKHTINLLDA
jgi:hypothetical protein